MTEISGEIYILLIGWLLGIFSSIIQPFLITPIKKWQDKRNFKKILRGDIGIKLAHLISIEQSLIEFFNVKTLDDAVVQILSATDLKNLPRLNQKIPVDFYNINYVKILDYFDKEPNILIFYQRILTLNLEVDNMENDKIRSVEEIRMFLSYYCAHLELALQDGAKLSML